MQLQWTSGIKDFLNSHLEINGFFYYFVVKTKINENKTTYNFIGSIYKLF